LTTKLSEGLKVVSTLAECLEAVGHPTRLGIVRYCLQPRKFTDIILELKLNPASFRFHVGVLGHCGLVKKTQRGVYETTELGKLVLELVNQATILSQTH
jgi:predicted transcriptional regulator